MEEKWEADPQDKHAKLFHSQRLIIYTLLTAK